MWNSVRKGEEENIFPFQEEADVMFNSSLVYELAVLKQYVEPLLFGVDKHAPEYIEDPNMYANQKEVVSEEVNGYKNVLHEETWLNGVLQPKEVILSETVVE